MPLHEYRIDFSSLSADERMSLISRLEKLTYNGVHWENDFQSCVFYVDEGYDIDNLKIPSACRLTRLS